jgi:hypothetical protein
VKRRLLVALALVGLLSAIPLAHAGATAQAIRSTSKVILMSDLSDPLAPSVGTSTLTRTDSGISFSLETTGLEPGHAVTIWWMVANPDGGVAVLYAAGHVIDDSGTAEFGGYLQVATTALPIPGRSPPRSRPSTPATPAAPTCRSRCTSPLPAKTGRLRLLRGLASSGVITASPSPARSRHTKGQAPTEAILDDHLPTGKLPPEGGTAPAAALALQAATARPSRPGSLARLRRDVPRSLV